MFAQLKRLAVCSATATGATLIATQEALGQRVPLPDESFGGVEVPTEFSSVPTAIRTIFNLIIAVAGAVFVILLFVGGIQYLTSAGNEENTAKARKLLVDAIIGLIIVLIAWAAGNFVLRRFGLNRRTF